jgi:hypothetical protein
MHVLIFIFWIINYFWGNNGGTCHLIWLWTTQIAAAVPVITIIYAINAALSYGTRDQTALSWFGATVSVTNGVSSIGPTISTFKSDYKYLLFKD